MALVNTYTSIAATTKLIRDRLNGITKIPVYANHPRNVLEALKDSENAATYCLGIFLYEASFDASMKNISLHDDRPAPLWLVLKYLLTAFDAKSTSEDIENFIRNDIAYKDEGTNTILAHNCLGIAAAALQSMSFLTIPPENGANEIRASLLDNPEELKITFDEISSDLVSKIIQSSSMDYCFSLGFQVRPVLIYPEDPPSLQYLVGIDYKDNIKEIGGKGIHVDVELLPVSSPKITMVNPPILETGTFTIQGENLNLSNLNVFMDNAIIQNPVFQANPETGRTEIMVDLDANWTKRPVSAGSYTLQIIQDLGNKKSRSSVPYLIHLLPKVTSVAKAGNKIIINGNHLGDIKDDIIVAFYQEGTPPVIKHYPDIEVDQERISVTIEKLKNGDSYTLVVRVNGEYALQKPYFIYSAGGGALWP